MFQRLRPSSIFRPRPPVARGNPAPMTPMQRFILTAVVR
jgi:hypothetical protein